MQHKPFAVALKAPATLESLLKFLSDSEAHSA